MSAVAVPNDRSPKEWTPSSGPVPLQRLKVHTVRPESIAREVPVGRPGIVLGEKYRLERRIATGGMASIWAARHVTLNRPVAVKFVDARMEVDEKKRIDRFLREATVAASVRHKNVVDILDFGIYVEDGVSEPYMVMELLEGEPLDLRMRRAPLSTVDAVDVLRQVLAGLEAVHAAGIVHRDLKPGNVFVSEDTDGLFARVLDFGISVSPDEDDARTVIGTPEYMSPEQALGTPVDARSDVYAVGVMLYELLAGFVPFDDVEPARILERVVVGKHRALANVRPDVPELSAIAEIAMSLDPGSRFASALAMKQALVTATRRDSSVEITTPERSIVEHPITFDSTLQEPDISDLKTARLRRPPRRGLRAAAGVLAIALFVGITWWLLPRPHVVRDLAPVPPPLPPRLTPVVVVPSIVPTEPTEPEPERETEVVTPPPAEPEVVEEPTTPVVTTPVTTTPRRASRWHARRRTTTTTTAPDRITRELDF